MRRSAVTYDNMRKIRLKWQQIYSAQVSDMNNYDLFCECNYLLDNLGLYDEKAPKIANKIDWKYDRVHMELFERLLQCCFFGKYIKNTEENNEEILSEYLEFKTFNNGSLDWTVGDELIKRFSKCGFFNNRYVIIEKAINPVREAERFFPYYE